MIAAWVRGSNAAEDTTYRKCLSIPADKNYLPTSFDLGVPDRQQFYHRSQTFFFEK